MVINKSEKFNDKLSKINLIKSVEMITKEEHTTLFCFV